MKTPGVSARAVIWLLALLMAGGCTKVGTTNAVQTVGGRHPYTRPHVLRYAAATDIGGLNPLIYDSQYEMYLAEFVMAFLIRADPKGEPIPELITEVPTQKNGGISRDGLTITWHLRKGVVWSDGAPFTADDVVFSTQQVLNPANNVVSRDGWELITKIDAPDKYTVVYHLKKRYGAYAVTFFSTVGANPSILPKHLLTGYKSLNNVPYNGLPVGIGPFKYRSWRRGESVTMVANDKYFRGRPKLDEIVFKIIPDRNTTLQQLRTHELDLWLPVSPHFEPAIKRIPGVAVRTIDSYVYDHLDFNVTRPAVADVAVRTALRYATDRKALNDKVQFGLYDLSEATLPVASELYDTKIGLVPFDIRKANAILDRAGWRRGADGIRSKDGVRLSLEFATMVGTPDTDQKIELIRGWWKAAGVALTVRHYLASLFFAPYAEGGILYTGKFDVSIFAWGIDPNADLANLYSCRRFPPDGQNDPRYCNQALTDSIDKAENIYDRTQRRALMDFQQEQVFRDVPVIILDSRKEIFAFNDDLRNWNPGFSNAPFDDMLNVDI